MPERKYTQEDLKTMQAWSLERKIQVTQTRLIEWYQKFQGKVYVSFSGGKDSTVLLHIARQLYPDIEAVFVDTGLEYPEIREFVKTFDNVTWLRPEMNFREVIKTYGYPMINKEVSRYISVARRCPNGKTAMKFTANNPHDAKYGGRYSVVRWNKLTDSEIPISHKCCDVMKKNPVKKYEKASGNKAILATMATESKLRKNAWMANGCNAFDAERPISQPMSFWTEQDVLECLRRYKVPYASVYGDIVSKNNKLETTGRERTGCVFCGFGAHLEKEPTRFQMLKETHPKLYNYCLNGGEYDDEGLWRPTKDGLGMRHVFEELNRLYGDGFIKYE